MNEHIRGRAAHSAEIQMRAEADMARMGVDHAFVEKLVNVFYARIRAHEGLGPVFENRLAGKWPDHLEKMKGFWSAIAFKTGAYGGKPVQAHHGISGLNEDLFRQWLALFSSTMDEIAPTQAAHDWFMVTAERIARSLTLSLFYNPALDDPSLRR